MEQYPATLLHQTDKDSVLICLIGNREVQLQCRTACGEGHDSSVMVDVIAAYQEEYLEMLYAVYPSR